jgi:Rrf2 family iron-sulfur cluster assembly transcriptional regulator
MRITTKGRYALRAVIALACVAAEDDPVSIRALAENEGLSPDFLEQIFFRLRRSGIVSSVRGPGGGFRLARPSQQISLHEILVAAGEGMAISGVGEAERDRSLSQPKAHKVRRGKGSARDDPWPGIGTRTAALVLEEFEGEVCRFAAGKSLADMVGAATR